MAKWPRRSHGLKLAVIAVMPGFLFIRPDMVLFPLFFYLAILEDNSTHDCFIRYIAKFLEFVSFVLDLLFLISS